MRWEYNLTQHLLRNESYQAWIFVMFTFPDKWATHWISFLCQVSFPLYGVWFFFFKWFYFLCFWFALFQEVSRAGATPLPFPNKEQTNVSKHDPVISVLKNPKQRCKNVVNVRLKVSLSGLHISDSFVYQRNPITLKRAVRFAVVCIKWCLFSILTLQVTSEGATSTGFCTYM